ncbi:MAG: hypothetical protein BWK72_07395 [Rhodoferax ferrireducens]|uniref:Uncharacterized protein n=1 Tax=Rhodoferax ferrireducens TaxID=192843 RepID=A0A1W9KW15_9BURK|nr:MAG: hypothetical protein BWK72_07395 [Rhodoferax ferrireducens]
MMVSGVDGRYQNMPLRTDTARQQQLPIGTLAFAGTVHVRHAHHFAPHPIRTPVPKSHFFWGVLPSARLKIGSHHRGAVIEITCGISWVADDSPFGALTGRKIMTVDTVDRFSRGIFAGIHTPFDTTLVEQQGNGSPALIPAAKTFQGNKFVIGEIDHRFVVKISGTDPQAVSEAVVVDRVYVLCIVARKSPAHLNRLCLRIDAIDSHPELAPVEVLAKIGFFADWMHRDSIS